MSSILCNLSLRSILRSYNRRFARNSVLLAVCDIEFPLLKSPKTAASIGIIRLPVAFILTSSSFPFSFTMPFTTAQPMLFVPKSSPRMFFIVLFFINFFPNL